MPADLSALLADPGAFHARYQPLVDVVTRAPVAYEALLHATAGDVPVEPGELFAAARETGRLPELDRIGREVAIRGAAGWLGAALLFVKLEADAGALRPDWLDGTRAAATEAGVAMRRIVLEVPQPRPGASLEQTARVVIRCRGAGCQVALVGAADPAVVRHLVGALLPEYVTLARSVVAELPGPEAVAAARQVVREAAAGGAQAIAFGVETERQAAAVAELGVPWAQGWLYGRPRRPA